MARIIVLAMLVLMLGACNAQQSTLMVLGEDARAIRCIAIVLTIGAVLILVVTATVYFSAVSAPEDSLSHA